MIHEHKKLGAHYVLCQPYSSFCFDNEKCVKIEKNARECLMGFASQLLLLIPTSFSIDLCIPVRSEWQENIYSDFEQCI